jgi:predicted transcriptional regulator of viral defense system
MADKILRLEDWVEHLQTEGQNSFSLSQARQAFKNISENALSLSLARYSDKNKILSILRGFYLILSPKYAAMKVIPPVNFIDSLMKSLDRPYYVGLLSAAALQGASHQQPQEFFVFTDMPAMRAINKNGIKVNFLSLVHFPSNDLFEKIKTEVGYLNISPAALTALDLIYFESRIGGLSRAATVLSELVENIKPVDFTNKILRIAKTSTIQRLGYIFENILNRQDLADVLLKYSEQAELNFSKIKLDPSCESESFPVDKKWKIIVNTTIELD